MTGGIKVSLVLVWGVHLLSVGAAAEESGAEAMSCRAEQTVAQCREALKAAWRLPLPGQPQALVATEEAEAKAEELKSTLEQLQKRLPAGVAAFPGAETTIADFLSRLRITLATRGVGEDDDAALAVELGNFFGLPKSAGYRLDAVLRPAEVDGRLGEKLDDDAKEKATGGLGDFDDVLVEFAWSPKRDDFRMNELSELLVAELESSGVEKLRLSHSKAQSEFAELESRLIGSDGPASDFGGRFDEISDAELRQRFMAAVGRESLAELRLKAALAKRFASGSLSVVRRLVENQPKFVFEASHTLRDVLVGPDETSAKLVYEFGRTDLGDLRKHCRARGRIAVGPDCLETFLDSAKLRQLSDDESQQRFSFSAEYTRTDAWQAEVSGVMASADSAQRWTIAAAYGRNLRSLEDGTVETRLEVTGRWEEWSDDPMRQNRGVIQGSLTQRLTGDLAAVVGVVWATEPEFRGDVDEEVSARAGFTFKVDRKSK